MHASGLKNEIFYSFEYFLGRGGEGGGGNSFRIFLVPSFPGRIIFSYILQFHDVRLVSVSKIWEKMVDGKTPPPPLPLPSPRSMFNNVEHWNVQCLELLNCWLLEIVGQIVEHVVLKPFSRIEIVWHSNSLIFCINLSGKFTNLIIIFIFLCNFISVSFHTNHQRLLLDWKFFSYGNCLGLVLELIVKKRMRIWRVSYDKAENLKTENLKTENLKAENLKAEWQNVVFSGEKDRSSNCEKNVLQITKKI